MPRAAGILWIATLALVAGVVGVRPLWPGGGPHSARAARARPAGECWLDPAKPSTGLTRRAAGASGCRVTVRNDMPATLTITTRPDGQTYRVGWGGGDVALGTEPVDELVIVYYDAYWPYVYAVSCPASHEAVRLCMSDVWHGRVPEGFLIHCGRPERDGVAWFNDERDRRAAGSRDAGSRGQGVEGPRGRG